MDGWAPNVHQASMGSGRGHTDLWVYPRHPILLSDDDDAGNIPYDFPGPPRGGHLRVVQSQGKPADYDPGKDPEIIPPHEPRERPEGRTWDRGGNNAYSSAMHKTATIDYAILLEGERVLQLDDREIPLQVGDVVIQVAAWHRWTSPRIGGRMAFDMIAAEFDNPLGTPTGARPGPDLLKAPALPDGVKPTRRIVTIDGEDGRSTIASDGPSPDVRTDPARPGFASTRLWVTDRTPAQLAFETLHLPHTIEPPANGTVCRVLTVPPDRVWQGNVGRREVEDFFRSMGSPRASTYSAQAPHPYMQKTRTLDFCIVLDGDVDLVLDHEVVHLKAGDIVIQRGTNHAWSNPSNRPAVIVVSSHDGRW
jgi:quercetin dioxygenase-like cupin family protein